MPDEEWGERDAERAEGIALHIHLDPDGTCKLTAAFRFDGFAGTGSAWFDRTGLEEFATACGEYPLREAARRGIIGGYWATTGDIMQIQQEHLSLSAWQKTPTGRIAVRIHVATPYQERDGETESLSSASVEIPTTYANLARFAGEMQALLSGYSSEAFLVAER